MPDDIFYYKIIYIFTADNLDQKYSDWPTALREKRYITLAHQHGQSKRAIFEPQFQGYCSTYYSVQSPRRVGSCHGREDICLGSQSHADNHYGHHIQGTRIDGRMRTDRQAIHKQQPSAIRHHPHPAPPHYGQPTGKRANSGLSRSRTVRTDTQTPARAQNRRF